MEQKLRVGQQVYIIRRLSKRQDLVGNVYKVSAAKIDRISQKHKEYENKAVVDVIDVSNDEKYDFILHEDRSKKFWLSHYFDEQIVVCLSEEDVGTFMKKKTRYTIINLREKSDRELLNLYKQYKQIEKDGIIDDREFFKECRAAYPEKNKESIEYYATDMMKEIARRWADMFDFPETNQYRPKVTSVSD